MLGDVLQMSFPLRGRSLCRVARHGGRARRDDDGRFRVPLGYASIDAGLVALAIVGGRGHRARDLVEQGANLGTVVGLFGRERSGDDLAGVGIHADVQLPPRPSRLGAVLLQQLPPRAAPAKARAVHQQVQGLAAPAQLRARHHHSLGPVDQGRVVRHAQSSPCRPTTEPIRPTVWTQRQAEHGLERDGYQDGQRGIPGLAARCGARRCPPVLNRRVREPDREAPTLA